MKTFLAVCILLGSLAVVSNGQTTCSTTSLPVFSLAATRLANQNDPNQYFVIGGMFNIHQLGSTAYECSAEFSDMGFVNMLAFFWGIYRYLPQNAAANLLSVGGVAFDSCMRPDQTIQNMYDYAQCRINIQNMERGNVVAYVGPYMNDDAKMAGALAEDLGITVFSPMADTDSINYMDQKTLLKMRPSFTYDLKAIVEFLNKVNAQFVIILYSGNDPYWRVAYEALTTMITSNKAVTTCIQYTADVDNEQMSSIIANLATKMFVKYIVPLTSKSSLDSVMAGLFQNSNNYIFIINSRIGRDLMLMVKTQAISDNSIIVEPVEPPEFVSELNGFNSFLANLTINNTIPGISDGTGNAWLSAFLAKSSLPNLTNNTAPSPMTFSVYRTLLSVKTILKGMDSAIIDCGTLSNVRQFCNTYRNQMSKATHLYEKFRNTTNNYQDNSGNLKYEYSGYSYYIFSASKQTKFTLIGNMNVNSTGGVSSTITNLKDTAVYGNVFSDSTCPRLGIDQCCEFPTTTAAPTTAANLNGTGSAVSTPASANGLSQVQYPTGQAITGAYSNEMRMDSEYGTRFDVGQKWIIALGVLAGLGILCVVIFEVYILYKLLGTPTGSKWRTMWLGQLLLFGVFLCYIVLFAYLPIPTKATCGITRFGVGVSYAFCFSVLLVKLMVILTSKPSDVLMPGDIEMPNYLKGTYQFLLFLLSLGVQVVIDVQWLITVPPEAVKVYPNSGPPVWVCNHYTWQAGSYMNVTKDFVRTNFENHVMSLIYVMVLILITTVLSLKAHGIITNHRESIFVGIASGFTIPIWLAWGLVGGLNKSQPQGHEYGDACVAFGLLATATLILFSMFLPKVRHLVNMGVEGIYLEDDMETIVNGGSVIVAPSSYKSKGSGSVIYVNNQGIYSEPVIITNGDPMSNHLKHPGSVYSAPGGAYLKHPESVYGGSTRVFRVTDLRGHQPQKRSQSEVAYGSPRKALSHKGTLPRSRSQTKLGAL